MTNILGSLTAVFSLLVIFVGVTRQIVKNWRDNKSGLDPLFSIFVLCMNIFRLAYGILIKAWFVVIPDCFGLFFAVMLFCQLFSPRLWNIEQKAKKLFPAAPVAY